MLFREEQSRMRRRFYQLDVFGSGGFTGNPLAVVVDSDGLSAEEMARFASWTNLSETAFLLPTRTASADYRVRIFSLSRELSFAGHPTLGSCQAWLSSGGQPKGIDHMIQECGAGLIPIRRTSTDLAFAAPTLARSGPIDRQDLGQLATTLGIGQDEIVDSRRLSEWAVVVLRDADAVLEIEPVLGKDGSNANLNIGIVGPYPEGSECAFEVRALFSDEHGELREDPVTGSLNGMLAQWLFATGRAKSPYVVSQGARVGRTGRLRVSMDADAKVWVAGATAICVSGEVDI